MDSVQVGKAVFGKEIFTTLGIEPRTYSYPGRSGNPCSVCWVKKILGENMPSSALENFTDEQIAQVGENDLIQ